MKSYKDQLSSMKKFILCVIIGNTLVGSGLIVFDISMFGGIVCISAAVCYTILYFLQE